MGGEEACPAHETPIGCGCLLSNLTGTPYETGAKRFHWSENTIPL